MSRYSLEETRRQLGTVTADLPALASVLGAVQRPTARRIWLCGNGDSRAAALMVAVSAPPIGRVRVVHPWQLTTGAVRPHEEDLVVLVSASGSSDAIVEAAQALAPSATPVLGATGNAMSELARIVDTTLVWTLGPSALGPSPAVRTFAATYLALAALCGLLADDTVWQPRTGANLDATLREASALADWLVGNEAPPPTYLATGRHRGAAEFARSKSIEISGVSAVASDPGEWFHVDRHAAPPFGPLVAFSDEPPTDHLKICLEAALDQGRRVAVVGPGGGDRSWRTLDVSLLPPVLRPLAAALVGVPVGLRQAALLGRRPFVNKSAG